VAPEFVQITEDHLEEIRQWMDNQDDNSELKELLFFKPLKAGLMSEYSDPTSAEVHYYQVLIRRKRVNCGYKYWVDIAYRTDTGEPLLFVSHEGNIEEYYHELKLKKEKSI
jgi:hypothetical protein